MLASICLGFCVLALLAPGCDRPRPAPTAISSTPPSIILISIDTLGREGLEEARTPRIDAFAAGAARFSRAYSPSSWTLPAHASLMTGQYPDKHGAVSQSTRINRSAATLARGLWKKGYETIGFSDGGYTAAVYGMALGFDFYNQAMDSQNSWTRDLPRGGRGRGARAEEIFDRAIQVIEKRSADEKPLFMFLHTFSVHDYYKQHPETLKIAGLEGARATKGSMVGCVTGRRHCGARQWDHLRRLYLAEIERVDTGLGVLFDAIRAHLDPEQTVVILTSDHGEAFDWKEKRIHHGGRLTADQLEIPLSISGFGQPGEYSQPVSLVDLAPTLLEIAGAAPMENPDGRSLAPLLSSGAVATRDRPIWGMEHFIWWHEGRRRELDGPARDPLQMALIRAGNYYVLDRRSGESQPPVLPEGVSELLSSRGTVMAPSAESVELDADLREELRGLGYIE